MTTPRVLLLVLDGLPNRHVGPRVTPTLASWAGEGGRARAGGRAVVPTCTYPNHATFATGVGPVAHGIWANNVPGADRVVRPAREVGPGASTIFDACRDAGRRSAAVLGDHHLVGVMGARAADTHWPLDGVLAAETLTDPAGYAADSAVLDELCSVLDDPPDLVVAHFNEPDTAGHLHGPDSDGALEQYRATDAVLVGLRAALAPRWRDWVVLVVSDHDQETVTVDDPVDLAAGAARAGIDVTVVPEGGAALAAGADPTGGRWLGSIGGVAGSRVVAPGLRLVWTDPGHYTGSAPTGLRGVHGGPLQSAQVAVCTGGHPAVRGVAAALSRRRPNAADWPCTVAALLRLHLPAATGQSLSPM